MTRYDAIQAAFAAALWAPERAVPDGLTACGYRRPERRFTVHRNNAISGLVRALAQRFPITAELVGAVFFAGMAREFVLRLPPRSPVLLDYGDELAGFIEGFAPAAELPYLADIARLEAAHSRACHAADVAPLDPATLSNLDSARLPDMVVMLHPAAEIVRSPHPVATIWAMHAGETTLAPVTHWVAEDVLVTRPQLTVSMRLLPPGGAAFLLALGAGVTLASAIEAALDDAAEFDLTANLAGALGAGVFTGIALPQWLNAR